MIYKLPVGFVPSLIISTFLLFLQCEKENPDPGNGSEGMHVYHGSILIESESASEVLAGFFREGYDAISGNLVIHHSEFVDLGNLVNLRRVEGFVSIDDYTLTSVSFLENLAHVGGSFELTAFRLASVDPLNSLVHIGGLFRISILETSDITSFESLEKVGGIRFEGCGNALPFRFPKVRHLDQLSIEYCAFETLQGLESIESVGELVIKKCDDLTDLSGLDRIDSVENMALLNNENLRELQGVEMIRYLKRCIIHSNPNLVSLNGLQNLNFLGFAGISANENLVDYCALPYRANGGDLIGFWADANGWDPTIEQLAEGKCRD